MDVDVPDTRKALARIQVCISRAILCNVVIFVQSVLDARAAGSEWCYHFQRMDA